MPCHCARTIGSAAVELDHAIAVNKAELAGADDDVARSTLRKEATVMTGLATFTNGAALRAFDQPRR